MQACVRDHAGQKGMEWVYKACQGFNATVKHARGGGVAPETQCLHGCRVDSPYHACAARHAGTALTLWLCVLCCRCSFMGSIIMAYQYLYYVWMFPRIS